MRRFRIFCKMNKKTCTIFALLAVLFVLYLNFSDKHHLNFNFPSRQRTLKLSRVRFSRSYQGRLYQGKPFSTEAVKYLAHFGLDDDDDTAPDQEADTTANNVEPIFVTACSTNHFVESWNLLKSISRIYDTKVLIIYDIGLWHYQREGLKKVFRKIIIELKSFPFSAYPRFVRKLDEYRWKSLMIAEELRRWGNVVWVDSSIVVYKNVSEISKYYEPCWNCTTQRRYYPWLLFDYTGHSIQAATHPQIFDYFPTPRVGKNLSMFGAGLEMVRNSSAARRAVLRYWVLCSLEEECMGPAGARLVCHFSSGGFGAYAGCHRFDQSVLNVLLAWANGFDPGRYFFDQVDGQVLKVERIGQSMIAHVVNYVMQFLISIFPSL